MKHFKGWKINMNEKKDRLQEMKIYDYVWYKYNYLIVKYRIKNYHYDYYSFKYYTKFVSIKDLKAMDLI